ncbi:ABC transporter ATP-binding protein [Paenactinomyces guangxiensis]|uniref:ABC transporter ATP-binding protein n=1 Tax=Paenactinomyces guangxiensis TaxID=1490290 RepID=A0A7W2A7E4_9BACL|nr:ABC transporter ATP-binding protein [Paenactinomyces guangxiensis]MBA4493460.1 ABC transporter ATP-binding protein [Paenactinomyces guangxiensis]MBH8590551.1 ABC transporter ATP-binding protein [Paenactinomyces guangxiensis]
MKKNKLGLFHVYIWCMSILRPYLVSVVMLILCGLTISVCELYIPKYIQYLIDKIIPNRDVYLLTKSAFIVLFFLVFRFLASSGKEILQRNIQEKATRDLQLKMLKKLHRLGLPFIEKNTTGKILSLLNTEVAAMQKLYGLHFPEMVQYALFSVVAIFLMLNLSVKLSLIIIPCFFLYYIIGPYLEKQASLAANDLATSQINLGQKLYESISSLTELRANNACDWDLQRAMRETETNINCYTKRYWYAYWRGTCRRLSYYTGAVALFIYGFFLIGQHKLSVGGFVAFLLIYFNTMSKLTSVITAITEQKILMFQAEKIYSFMNEKEEVKEPKNPNPFSKIKGQITFENVQFSYGNEQRVLKGLNFTISPGEKVGFVGHSGSGKSTILKLFGRFYDPQQGKIYLDGIPIEKLSFAHLRSYIGFVFQDIYLFGTTIRENIRFSKPEATDSEIIEAAKAAYLHDFIMELPDKYDTYIGERGVKLSGGQRQRLALARIFLSAPTVVILDEPTSSLDNLSEGNIQQSLKSFFRNHTVITVAHRLSTIRHYDKIIVINKGNITEIGTYDELVQKKGAFYRLQKKEGVKRIIYE